LYRGGRVGLWWGGLGHGVLQMVGVIAQFGLV
jgi:hypothetical protein